MARIGRALLLLLLPCILVVVWALGPVAWVLFVLGCWRWFRRRRLSAER